nr:hypothetical protein BaRGS_024389 [Batillaria attramentaria]
MVYEALQRGDPRTGVSLQAVCNYILGAYPTANAGASFRFHVRSAIARGLAKGEIKRAKKSQEARGIQGRFLLDKSKKTVTSEKPKAQKRARSTSASPERPRKVAKDGVKKSTIKATSKVKAASKVAKPRSRSVSPAKGKAKMKAKAGEKGVPKAKKPAASRSKASLRLRNWSPKATKKLTPKKTPEKAATKKTTPKKMAAKKAAPKGNTTPKKKTTPKKPAKKTKP